MDTLGVYIHIPFCKSKCIYCDFYSLTSAKRSLMDNYLAAVKKHTARMSVSTYTVDTIYFGGGTPTVFGSERLCSLLNCIKDYFSVDENAEITVEANPESASESVLLSLRQAGFNRVSFGVQSFHDSELQMLGRLHNSDNAVNAVLSAKSAGFENISVDLMYGLPKQTPAMLRQNIEKAVSLPINHISCYGLRPEAGTPLSSSPLMSYLPDDDMQADMYIQTCSFLERQGFYRYEISNFSQTGKESRHNIKYWRLEPYLGLGAASHSDFNGRRFCTVSDVNTYIDAETNKSGSESEDVAPSAHDRIMEYIMLSLRTRDGMSLHVLEQKYGLNTDAFKTVIDHMCANGLGTFCEGKFSLTTAGMLLSNRVIGEFWDIVGN